MGDRKYIRPVKTCYTSLTFFSGTGNEGKPGGTGYPRLTWNTVIKLEVLVAVVVYFTNCSEFATADLISACVSRMHGRYTVSLPRSTV